MVLLFQKHVDHIPSGSSCSSISKRKISLPAPAYGRRKKTCSLTLVTLSVRKNVLSLLRDDAPRTKTFRFLFRALPGNGQLELALPLQEYCPKKSSKRWAQAGPQGPLIMSRSLAYCAIAPERMQPPIINDCPTYTSRTAQNAQTDHRRPDQTRACA